MNTVQYSQGLFTERCVLRTDQEVGAILLELSNIYIYISTFFFIFNFFFIFLVLNIIEEVLPCSTVDVFLTDIFFSRHSCNLNNTYFRVFFSEAKVTIKKHCSLEKTFCYKK